MAELSNLLQHFHLQKNLSFNKLSAVLAAKLRAKGHDFSTTLKSSQSSQSLI